ncbi:MAG: flagellar hook-length control protein FliK [Rhodocyclaceae bacterium]|jgi:flagellar hook-length control protein FliK|nr:flagellar hook-length control protein FliK [Rhodocyclaceae bacterium]
MPANLSAASGQAVSAVQNILHPASAAASGLATAADTPAGDQAPSFAALFRQLAARQLSGDDAPITLRLQADAVAATVGPEAEASDALTALLPFLEGMGMLPSDGATPATGQQEAEDLAAQLSTEDVASSLAVPLAAAPAITAATLPEDIDTPAADARSLLAAGASGEAIQDSHTADMTAAQADRLVQTATQAAGSDTGRGREFAAQLVAAIDASKEGTHAPGSTSAAVHQVLAATPSHGNTPAVPATPLQIAQPVGTPGWGEEVGNRIVWMANRMESRAELVLTPPQMGRVEVSLTISGDQASANFASANPAVRDALEAALPRLREVLADAGIQLGQAQVGAENPGQTAREDKNGDNPGFDRAGERDAGPLRMTETGMSSPAGLKSGRGLVDVFA